MERMLVMGLWLLLLLLMGMMTLRVATVIIVAWIESGRRTQWFCWFVGCSWSKGI